MRIRNLHDLMHNPEWLDTACRRVLARSRNKALGVDGEAVWSFEKSYDHKLENLRLELKRGTYRPQPLKRVMIPKANGKMRALGIPCLRDKIVQEAMKMALEPIFEVEFHPSSYGFRPHRSAHHAVHRCQNLIKHGFSWVIEGDIKACFDEIAHESIIRNLREKIMDNKFLALVGLFLKAGVMVKGVIQPTEKGVPQGGVLSPLLANIVLNRLDWFLHGKGDYVRNGDRAHDRGKPNTRFVRYADDWCVFITRAGKRYASALREQIRALIRDTAGLELSAEKTHITHVRDGFDFLGFRISKGTGRSGAEVPKIKVGEKAKKGIRLRLSEAIHYRPQQESMVVRMERAAKLIRGWSEYFRQAHDFPKLAGRLDHHAFWETVKAACRKSDISTAKCFRRHYRNGRLEFGGGPALAKFSDVKTKYHYRKPEEYNPGKENYFDNFDNETTYTLGESKKRRGSRDLRWEAMVRDSMCCQKCGATVNCASARIDHTIPVKRFASFQQAHQLKYLQTLCVKCHQEKTNEERRSQ